MHFIKHLLTQVTLASCVSHNVISYGGGGGGGGGKKDSTPSEEWK